MAEPADSFITLPSITGVQLRSFKPHMLRKSPPKSPAGLPRRHATIVGWSVQPREPANFRPEPYALSGVTGPSGVPTHPPLWEIALSNNPFAGGEINCMQTLLPPADSPKIVTFRGSPPKAPMFSRTHRSAACW